MSDSGYTPNTAMQFVCVDGDHHWVSSHEPNAPIWVIACSICGRHNFKEMLTAHDAEVARKAWHEGLHAAYNHVDRLEDASAAGQGVMVPDPVNTYRDQFGESK